MSNTTSLLSQIQGSASFEPEPKLWHIVFTPGVSKLPWYQRLAMYGQPKQFGHIYLYSPITEHHAIVIEPTRSSININVSEYETTYGEVMMEVSKEHPTVEILLKPHGIRHITNYVPSCVSVAKIILGFPCSALTPLGLYRSLLRHGGTPLNPKGA